ncbi:hypothetical protein DRP77_09995 [Candidatus Poribacteria bacterium]|nr:MAG: hypothetical protein DRP77_09995 [Candidatus Poribacteria bacterium]
MRRPLITTPRRLCEMKALKALLSMILPIFIIIGVSNAQDEYTVALYLFDEGKGEEVKDLSGNGNHGQLIGPKWEKGKFGWCLKFDGVDDYVLVKDSDSLDLTDGLTIEFWIYLNNYSTAGGNGVTKENSYKVGVYKGKKAMIRLTTTTLAWGAAVVYGKSDVPLKSWHHIAATYDASTGEAKVYLDGKLDGSGKLGGKIVPNDEPLWIGRGLAPYLDGLIDEVRISKVARSEEEIKEAMMGLERLLSLNPSGKLPIAWGRIKSGRRSAP